MLAAQQNRETLDRRPEDSLLNQAPIRGWTDRPGTLAFEETAGRAVPLILCAILVACQAPAASEGFRVDATDSGIPWARNTGSGSWGESERWTVQVGLELGVADGTGADVFGSIRSITVGDDGEVFVLDAMAQEVRVFDGNGAHLRSFGRRGEGPGEFGYADGLALDPDGRVWV